MRRTMGSASLAAALECGGGVFWRAGQSRVGVDSALAENYITLLWLP